MFFVDVYIRWSISYHCRAMLIFIKTGHDTSLVLPLSQAMFICRFGSFLNFLMKVLE